MMMLPHSDAGVVPSVPESLRAGRARRVGVLVNPRSGRNVKGIDSFLRVLCQDPQALWRRVVTPEDVGPALKEMAAREVDVLAISGGDGTLQAVLTALFRGRPFAALPPLAVLAGGTTNLTAADVGITGKPAHALHRLLAWAECGGRPVQLVKRAVLRVERGPGYEPLFGMFFSAAGIVQVTRARWDSRRRAQSALMRGGLGTAATVGRYLFGLALGRRVVTPTRIAVHLDGQPHDTSDYLALFITTLGRITWGIRPYWGEGPGPLRYTAIAYQPKHLFLAAPALLCGRPNPYARPEFGYSSRNISEAVLALDTECALDGQIVARHAQHPVVVKHAGYADFLQL